MHHLLPVTFNFYRNVNIKTGNKYSDSQHKMILRLTHLFNVFNILITLLNTVAVRQVVLVDSLYVDRLGDCREVSLLKFTHQFFAGSLIAVAGCR